jgi:SPP1 gp7 family putative phage head morphogenesis protein
VTDVGAPPPEDSFRIPAAPDARAVAFLEGKSVQRSWRWPSIWREEHRTAFTLAGVWRADVLSAAHELVTDAVRTGETFESFQGRFEQRMEQLGFAGPQRVTEFEEGPRRVNLTAPWRVKVIYDTNLRQAYAASEWRAIEDTAADFPALEYDGVPVQHNREHHKAFWGLVLRVDHPFWRTHFPPNGFHCRCYVIQVSADELRAGLRRLSSDAELADAGYTADRTLWEDYYDPKTGRTDVVPPGVHPGFGYNVGRERDEALEQLAADRVTALPAEAAEAGEQLRAALPAVRERRVLERVFAAERALGDLDGALADLTQQAASAGWAAPPEALAAVRAYTGELGPDLNRRLRTDESTPQDETLRVLIERGIDGLPAWTEAAWRAPEGNPAHADRLWRAAVDGEFLDLGRQFQSASAGTLTPARRARRSLLLLRIVPLRAALVSDLSLYPEQEEVLFGADARFRVLRRTEEEITFDRRTRIFRVIELEQEA